MLLLLPLDDVLQHVRAPEVVAAVHKGQQGARGGGGAREVPGGQQGEHGEQGVVRQRGEGSQA